MNQKHLGLLCSFEGIDGSGKSSLVQLVAQELQKKCPVITTKEPGGTEFGKQLRAILQHSSQVIDPKAEFLLFAADRAHHFTEKIIPHLKQNYIVLSDRMADSSLVYQGYVKGVDLETMRMINTFAMQNYEPNIVFYIKLDPSIALERIKKHRAGFTEFEHKILPQFEKISDGYDQLLLHKKNVIVIDGTQELELSAQQIIDEIIKLYSHES